MLPRRVWSKAALTECTLKGAWKEEARNAVTAIPKWKEVMPDEEETLAHLLGRCAEFDGSHTSFGVDGDQD